MGTLYEITNDLETVINGGMIIDEVSGEVIFDADNLEELETSFGDKLEACGLFIKQIHADASAIRAEELALANRRRVLEAKEKRLKEYVAGCMGKIGSKFSTPRVALSVRKSEAVEVDEDMVSFLPKAYVNTNITLKADKKAIKQALKDGEHIDGAWLVERHNLVVK